jgi:CheY-like chemotaxis protein
MKKLDDSILIMDDEPHILDWLVEYLEAKNYKTKMVVNVGEAIEALNDVRYRVVILDLNVPAPGEYGEKLGNKGGLYEEYRGLYVAEYARTKGHRGRQVVVYSVHDSDPVSAICEKIGVEYLIKGRPRDFKRELDQILSYDPTKDQA